MSKKDTIVIISNTHWHSSWQTGNSVAHGFEKRGYRVLFLEPIPKRWPKFGEVQRVMGRLTKRSEVAGHVNQPIPEGVVLISPLTLPDVGKIPQELNRRFFVPRVVSQLKDFLKDSRRLILIHTLPVKAAIWMQRQLKPDISIYRCVWDWTQDPHSQRELAEEELQQEVDLAWADCEHNLKRLRSVNPRSLLMPPAVDLSLFTSVTYTQSGRAKPLCVYFGAIGLSVDLDLLRIISQNYSLRLIGPVRRSLEGFAEETEIIGPVAHEQIPTLIRDADILLLPYSSRPHMKGLIPAKLFECLITGKPIVATNLTTLDQYRELVYLCEGQDEVLRVIEAASLEDGGLSSRRIACAKRNSWVQRITQMEEQIEALLAAKFPSQSRT